MISDKTNKYYKIVINIDFFFSYFNCGNIELHILCVINIWYICIYMYLRLSMSVSSVTCFFIVQDKMQKSLLIIRLFTKKLPKCTRYYFLSSFAFCL